ncbi:MAG: hypothetical protein KA821_14455 [Chitinophagaceae bacterium]|nr:hypothetical protein [Chitinophagaceae bacterium]
MIIQKIIKGIHGLSDAQAEGILREGIKSNWLRNVTNTNISETDSFWTIDNLLLHINGYDELIPRGHPLFIPRRTFGEVSPFISTTAGTYETEMDIGEYVFQDPLFTSLSFATDNFMGDGHIFYAYVFVLGRKSISFQQFSEEVREVNIYTDLLGLDAEKVASLGAAQHHYAIYLWNQSSWDKQGNKQRDKLEFEASYYLSAALYKSLLKPAESVNCLVERENVIRKSDIHFIEYVRSSASPMNPA